MPTAEGQYEDSERVGWWQMDGREKDLELRLKGDGVKAGLAWQSRWEMTPGCQSDNIFN